MMKELKIKNARAEAKDAAKKNPKVKESLLPTTEDATAVKAEPELIEKVAKSEPIDFNVEEKEEAKVEVKKSEE